MSIFHLSVAWQPVGCIRAPLTLSLLMMVSLGVWAQPKTDATLATVTVTGNPLGSTELIVPVQVHQGDELLLRAKSTLGETLDGTPGVSSTYFGPNASRPMIRGLDGDRIRILNNGAATIDVSGLSFDHAVTLDPLVIERIEVLRGPGALQYGGSAVGGVVNVIDNRIPREPLFDAKGGVSGRTDLGLSTGNREQSGAAVLEAGNHTYAIHADVLSRNTQDVSVPVSLNCTRAGVTTNASRICNSASETWGGALGGSLFFDHGYLGASVSTFGTGYGTVGEANVRINMQSTRLALDGEVRNLSGLFSSVRAQLSRTEYQHTEADNSVPSTVFKSAGNDLRVQARHARLGPLDGVIGLQLETTDFSANGDEAFVPFTRSGQTAVFAHEELTRSWGKYSFGARREAVSVESLGSPNPASNFVVGSRNFNPGSYALGVLWRVAPEWQLTTNIAASERAPKDYELFANGTHVATNAIEVGNSNLALERSSNFDVGAGWRRGAHRANVQAYVNQFGNYISSELTDSTTARPTFTYTQVQARFTGLETSANIRLIEAKQKLDLALRGDVVRAENTTTGQPLPRIAPMRLGATLIWSEGPWGARLGVDRFSAQDAVPTGQLATSGYALWNAAATYRTRSGRSSLLWYARLENMGNTLAYSASSILTQTAPGRAPLPGQNLKVGLQASF
jgi:iron complex outermembrane recepter protein